MTDKFSSGVSILTAIQNQVCHKAPALEGGNVIKLGNRVIQYTGGFSTVFKFKKKSGNTIAVRCWCAYVDNVEKRSKTISEYLKLLNSKYFVNFEYIEDALLIVDNGKLIKIPIVTMDWVEGKTLKDYLKDNIGNRDQILKLAEKFLEMVKFFHNTNIAHGDLQHGNIIITKYEDLKVLDYDGMYVNSMDGMYDTIKGYVGYQHPARIRNRFLNPKLDYFSELVIYLSLLVYAEYDVIKTTPLIWDYDNDYLVFSKEDFDSPNSSEVIKFLFKSEIPEISNLTMKLVDNLKYSDILQLEPLENILENKLDKLANEIIKMFKR